MSPCLRVFLFAGIAWGAARALAASEHRGNVTFHGLPVPGAVVTAAQGERKIVTSTDEDGTYSFPDLPDGMWTIEVKMTGFAPASREVGVAPSAPTAVLDLKLAPPAPPPPSTLPTPPAAMATPAGNAPGGPPRGRGGPPLTPAQAQAAALARAVAQLQAQDKAQARAAAAAAATAPSAGSGDSFVMSG